MGKRWPIASDPKLLERIARQEQARGSKGVPLKINAAHVLDSPPSKGGCDPAERKNPSQAVRRASKVAENNQDSRRDTMVYSADTNTLSIVLPGAQLLGLNVSLRMHDARSTKLKTTWLKRIEALMLTNIRTYDEWKKRAVFPLVVEEVYATGESACLDVESVTAACKPIIDALVRMRFIPDDSRDYICQPIGYTYRQRPHGLVITLKPSPKPWGLISDATMEIARRIPALDSE